MPGKRARVSLTTGRVNLKLRVDNIEAHRIRRGDGSPTMEVVTATDGASTGESTITFVTAAGTWRIGDRVFVTVQRTASVK